MVRNLKAIILAAGQGNRLKPLTNEKPKCMVELFGKSLITFRDKLILAQDFNFFNFIFIFFLGHL